MQEIIWVKGVENKEIVYQMHAASGLLLTDSLEKGVRISRNDLAEKERTFACECARTILHEQQIKLGMLTTYATSYYLLTDNVAIKTEKIGNGSKVQEKEIGATTHPKDLKDRTIGKATSEKDKWLKPPIPVKVQHKNILSTINNSNANRHEVLQ